MVLSRDLRVEIKAGHFGVGFVFELAELAGPLDRVEVFAGVIEHARGEQQARQRGFGRELQGALEVFLGALSQQTRFAQLWVTVGIP